MNQEHFCKINITVRIKLDPHLVMFKIIDKVKLMFFKNLMTKKLIMINYKENQRRI